MGEEYPISKTEIAGRDAVIDFRHQFCGGPSRQTILGDMENYTEYAEECGALAMAVWAAQQAVKQCL